MENENEIIVDSKEPQKVKDLFVKLGIKHKVENLPIGDFVCNNICMERKTMPDLISSIKQGHLQKQLLQMQENYERCFLLISGSYKDLYATGEAIRIKSGFNPYQSWTVEHHVGAMASLGARYPKIQMIPVDNDTQLVKCVSKIIEKCFDGKVVTKLDTELFTQKDKLDIEDIRLLMLKSIPGVGIERALVLRDHLDINLTLIDGQPVTREYLYRLGGFGPVMVDNILKVTKNGQTNK